MAVADLVAESFESDALRAALAWRGVRFGAVGPWSAGTAAMLLTDGAGNDGGAAGETVFAKGGPGALSDALAAAARAAGVEIRTVAPVVRITSRDGRATGVVLGAARRSRRAPSSPAPTRSGRCSSTSSTRWARALARLARREHPDARRGRQGQPRPAGSCRSSRRPAGTSSSSAAGSSSRRRIDAMERAFDATKYGRWSEQPDPRGDDPVARRPVARRGREGRHARHERHRPVRAVRRSPSGRRLGRPPREPSATRWSRPRIRGAGDRQARAHRQVLTPVDLERDYGLTGGHPLHAEPASTSSSSWRPLLGHARYRLALERLYLCGSGAHPGGGITGGPGQNAAREILSDLAPR